VRDAVALVRYFAWLENELVVNKNTNLNEYDAAIQSEKFRAMGDRYMGLSFSTISSTGSNAAIIHYEPTKEKNSIVSKDQVYLIDSGAQYLDGTTDTTRVVHYGTPSSTEKEMYTRVLLGNLAIERVKLSKVSGLTGGSIDPLARQYLWHVNQDYQHGTGHGVGHFLNVHEGPHGIGGYAGNPPLAPGMVVSNEPGYYLKDSFGIRIENIIFCKEFEKDSSMICFESLCMVPYENNLLDYDLLSKNDLNYLNEFHQMVKNIA
jgi:Xaa-Pro aminopeptidase